MVRVRTAVACVAVALTFFADPASAQINPPNTPIDFITVSPASHTTTVGQNVFFSATATLTAGTPLTRVLGGGGGQFWHLGWSPAISVGICGTGAVIFNSQALSADHSGAFHDVWSPGTPNTLKADGAFTMPQGVAGASISGALACVNGAATGSMSAFWTGTHYDGTYSFNGVNGDIIVVGLSFSSSDPTVATVDNRGKVTAVAPGDAVITAIYGSLCWTTTPGATQCTGTTTATATVHVDPDTGGGGGEPPLTAGPDRTVQCTGPMGAAVAMQGALFFEPTDPLTYVWTGPFPTATGLTPTVNIPLGAHTVTFTISDGRRSASDSANITVVDSQAPQIASITPSPAILWPPNHKMQAVELTVAASDSCTAPAALSCRIIAVEGNDGATSADWEITGPLSLNLRSTRTGGGSGRTYVITVECVDAAGNKTTRTVEIVVPHDRGR